MVVGAEYTIFFDKKIQKNFFLKIWAKMHNISFSNDDLPPTTLYPPPLILVTRHPEASDNVWVALEKQVM